MSHIRNREIMDLFRCEQVELGHLQRALKREMQEFYVGDRPFIGVLISKVDKEGTVREAVWESVAESGQMCEALLAGARWGRRLPKNFSLRLEKAKHEMERRLNGPYRQRAKEARMRQSATSVHATGLLHQINDTREDAPIAGPAATESVDVDKRTGNAIELNTARGEEPTSIEARPPLSASVQAAVERAVATLAARMSDLEDRESIRDQELNQRQAELEERVLRRIETVLAPVIPRSRYSRWSQRLRDSRRS